MAVIILLVVALVLDLACRQNAEERGGHILVA